MKQKAIPELRKELPVMDPRLCTGCGDCLRICPTRCLVKIETHPVITTQLACIRCGVCAQVCPTHAVVWALPVI